MSPLEAAKALDERGFRPVDADTVLRRPWCMECTAGLWRDAASARWVGHESDCPWLMLPKIVAALEAAQNMAVHIRARAEGETSDSGVVVAFLEAMGVGW